MGCVLTAVAVESRTKPAHIWIPPRSGSRVRAVEGVASKVGRSLDEPGRLALDVLTSAKADGRPAVLEACVICARQNLKTYTIENYILERLTAPDGVRLVVWSAHEVATAQETFKTFLDLIERYPWLAERVVGVSRSPGREEIRFRDPLGRKGRTRRLRFRARIKTGGRGLSGDVVVLDEAFALEAAHMGSLIPILSTRKNAQIIYGSSAALATSDVLRGVIERGRRGGAGSPAYIEWRAAGSFAEPGCAEGDCYHKPGTSGCSLDDEELWIDANPAVVSGRITLEYLRQERQALPPLEFARERLSWGEDAAGSVDPPFTVSQWRKLADPGVEIPPALAFSLFVGPDRDSWGIGVAGWLPDGRAFAHVAARGAGASLSVSELVRLVGQYKTLTTTITEGKKWKPSVVGDAWSLKPLLPDLVERGVDPFVWSFQEVAAACGGLQDGVRDKSLVHRGLEEVTAGLEGSQVRGLTNGWLWDLKKSTGDIVPLMALTLAHRALLLSDPVVDDWSNSFG